MKKNRYIFALITILVCGDYAFAADASVITSVILYPGNATIERTVRVAARASRVELTGLPANFDPRSVRVEADARIHVGEVSVHDIGHHRRSEVAKRPSRQRYKRSPTKKASWTSTRRSAELVRDYLARSSGTPVDGGNKGAVFHC